MKRCPKCNLKYDDSLSFCLEDGTRLLRAHDPDETLVLRQPELQATIPEVPVQAPTIGSEPVAIDDPVVVINIHQQYPFVRNSDDLYQCTRGLWRLNPRRAENARYLLGVYQGLIKEVYEINQCIPATAESRRYWEAKLLSQGRRMSPGLNHGRYEFIGRVAPDEVRNKYVGRRIPGRLTQNPVRYFNC